MTILQIIGWAAFAAVAFFLGKGGFDKIRGSQEAVGNFAYMKLEKYRTLVGLGELVGVILLAIPATSLFGVFVVISLMSAAAVIHLSQFGGAKTWLPVLVGVLSLVAHYLR